MNKNTEFTGEYYYPQHNIFRIPLKHQSQKLEPERVLDNEPEPPIFHNNRFKPRTKYLGKRRNELFGSSRDDHQLFPSSPDEDVPMPEVSSPKKPRIGSALRTKRRQQILNTEGVVGPNAYRCVACDIPLTSIHDARAHYSGRKHRAVVRQSTKVNQQDSSGHFGIGKAFNNPPPPPPLSAVSEESTSTPLTTPSLFFCGLCNISVTSEGQMKDHMEGAKHLKKLKETTEATVPPIMGEDTIMDSVVQCGKIPPKRDI
ncbi:uncharacterized protein DMENIID0001_060400 [Sergentomyia squamirostris]